MIKLIVDLSVMSGGLLPLMALLLLVTIAVIVERVYFFTRVLRAGESIEHDLQGVAFHADAELEKVAEHYKGSLQASILSTGIASRGQDADTMDRHIEEAILWQLPKMDRYMWVLDTSVTLAPLMGLFGTIIGMIDTFHVLGKATSGAPEVVTGGIGQALVATGAGLLIAIVAIVFLNYFNKRLRLAMHQMELIQVMVINRLCDGGAGRAPRDASKVDSSRGDAVSALTRVH
jgi:biopolymer transport protein ExbB